MIYTKGVERWKLTANALGKFLGMVAATGLEPVRSVRAADFKSAVYTNFTTRPAGLHPRRMLVSKPTVYALLGAKWQE